MIDIINIFTIGFSIIIALTLFVTYLFFIEHVNKSWITLCTSGMLLASLSLAQFNHYTFYVLGTDILSTIFYQFLILFIPPIFYFFSRAILFPDRKTTTVYFLHFLPLPLAFIAASEIVVPIAFMIGATYCLWLSNIVYKLRTVRKRFQIVFFLFGSFSVTAIIVLIIGFTASNFDQVYFYHFYTISIGVGFVLVTATLIIFPNILNEIDEVVRLGYSNSTLTKLNVESCKEKLSQLMNFSKMYQNENLSLTILSDEMQISNHQLSELINSQFNVGFSQYIRMQRIEAAKRLLKSEENISILSISMEVGFRSQSNFYAAFKEMTGESPGNYRKSALS